MTILREKLYKKNLAETPYEDWWTVSDEDAHTHMIQLINVIDENQSERKWDNLTHGKLYQDHPLVTKGRRKQSSVTYNVIKACIDTLVAKIGQNKPRPRVLTEKGDYEQQQKAKQLTQYLDGILNCSGAYRQGPAIFKDGGIFGTGALKVLIDDNEVKTERTLITELLVDDLEGAYGNPQSMFQKRVVSRSLLKQQFPAYAGKIDEAAPDEISQRKQKTIDLIAVYEGWHLGPEGKHVIAIDNCTLLCEPWKFKTFPFAFFRYNTSIASFYGNGIAEELKGTQTEINKILRDIQRAQNLVAVPRVWADYNSKLNTTHLNNEIGSVIKYTGNKPTTETATAMNNEIYNHVKWLIQSAFEKVGISQLTASSKKPAGLDSGRAIREFRDTESERFTSLTKQYEEFFEDTAAIIIEMSKSLYKTGVDSTVKTETRDFIETIKWSDVNLDADKFVLRIQSSSLFPTQPAARLQKVEELVRAGWISKESAIGMLDFPDVAAWTTLETAGEEYTAKIINDILSHGKYTPPEPEILPERAINYARKSYLEARRTGVSEERTELLLRWIEAASTFLKPVQPPTSVPAEMPMPPAEGPIQSEMGTPTATPMPLPQTGLAPQV